MRDCGAMLFRRTAAALAAMIRAGEVSCREVVSAHLARIDEVNPVLGAVTVPTRDAALAAADRADRQRPTGRLHGVPFTVKENLDCVGTATTCGVPALRENLPYLDAPIVARLRAAGAIPIARGNTSEMGLRLDTDNPLWGRTRNPWDRRVTAGGSSGGDAAAVATGMTPLGIGSDIGGSLRIPAGACGVACLKPTLGRIARASSIEPQDHGAAGQLMLVDGPIARSIADLRLVLELVAGRDARDPRSVDAPLVGPALDERRVALVRSLPGRPLPAATVAAIDAAGRRLAAAGWEVEEATPPEMSRAAEIWARLIAIDFAALVPLMAPIVSAPLVAHLRRIVAAYDPSEVSNHWVHVERSRLTREWSGFFSSFPAVIGPTWGTPLWAPDADLDARGGLGLLEDTVRFITPASVLGFPAVTVPLGVVDGHPISVDVLADLWREDVCLEVADIISVDMPTPIDPR